MVLVTLNIPHEIRELLKLEENQSELVSSLLIEHYDNNKEMTIKERMEKLQETKRMQIQKMEKEMKDLENKMQVEIEEKKIQIEFEEQRAEKKNLLIANCIQNTKDMFNIEISKEDANDFLEGNWDTIADFLDSKNLKKLEEDEQQENTKSENQGDAEADISEKC